MNEWIMHLYPQWFVCLYSFINPRAVVSCCLSVVVFVSQQNKTFFFLFFTQHHHLIKKAAAFQLTYAFLKVTNRNNTLVGYFSKVSRDWAMCSEMATFRFFIKMATFLV